MSPGSTLSIGLVLDHFVPRRGGAERYLSVLLQELAARGHDCHVYCRTGEGLPGVGQTRVLLNGRTRAGQEQEFARRAVQAARDAGRVVYAVRHVLDADLYQPHGGTWAATSAARQCQHRWPALHRWWRSMHPRYCFLARADEEVFRNHPGLLTVAVSDLVREDVLARYGRHAPRVQVAWPWVDAPHPLPERCDAGTALRLGFLAHNFALKGLDVLLAAMAEGDLREATLKVAGREDPRRWQRWARRLGVGGRVEFLGEVQDGAALFRQVDVLVHPTRHDPCALVCLEALAHGVAVVTTRFNGAAPFVSEAGGVVLEGLEPGSLAAGIAACDRAPSRAEQRRRAVAGLTRQDHVSRMEQLLGEAARSARP